MCDEFDFMNENLSSDLSDVELVLPSSRKNSRVTNKRRKRRPPKNIPPISTDFEDDDLFTVTYETKSTEKLLFEDKIVNYLDNTLKDLKKSFLEEFKDMTDSAFSLQPFLDTFFNSIDRDLRDIIDYSYEYVDLVPDDVKISLEKQFKSTLRLAQVKPAEEIEVTMNNEIDEAKTNFHRALNENLVYFKSERKELASMKEIIATSKASRMKDYKKKMNEIDAKAYEIGILKDAVDIQMKNLQDQQNAFRTEIINYQGNEPFFAMNEIAKEIKTLAQLIETTKIDESLQKSIDFSDSTRMAIAQIAGLNNRLCYSTEKLIKYITENDNQIIEDVIPKKLAKGNNQSELLKSVHERIMTLKSERDKAIKELEEFETD